MKPSLLVSLALLSALLLATFPAPACAETVTITFSDLGFGGDQSILIYNNEHQLVETCNTSSTVALDANYSYVAILKPDRATLFENPQSAIDYALLFGDRLVGWLPYIGLFIGFLALLYLIAARIWK